MNLYEIDSEILGCIDAETGEIIDFDKLDELTLQRDAKVENISLWIKNLSADAEALKQEKMVFAERQRVAENKIDSLKKYLSNYLEGTKFETSKVKISFRKSEAVEIAEDADIPEEFCKIKVDYDKTGLKAALKAGAEIEGVCIVEKQNIQIK